MNLISEVVMELWLKHQSQSELNTAFDQLADDLLKAKDKYRSTEELEEQIFEQILLDVVVM